MDYGEPLKMKAMTPRSLCGVTKKDLLNAHISIFAQVAIFGHVCQVANERSSLAGYHTEASGDNVCE